LSRNCAWHRRAGSGRSSARLYWVRLGLLGSLLHALYYPLVPAAAGVSSGVIIVARGPWPQRDDGRAIISVSSCGVSSACGLHGEGCAVGVSPGNIRQSDGLGFHPTEELEL
jgi:hypothetical protein